MLTRSKIQLIKEGIELANSFKDNLNDIMDKYLIEDNIFVYRDNKVFEVTSGYFEVLKEFDNLNEAISFCNLNNSGVRIIDNSRFIIGKIHKVISECNRDNQILDIEKFNIV